MARGLVIVGLSRSGTSMTAGLFAIHGVWVGRTRTPDDYNAKGYFENLDYKEALLKHYEREEHKRPKKPGPAWEEFKRLIPADHPWLMKFGVWYERDIPKEFPRLVVRRPIDQIQQSRKRMRLNDGHQFTASIARLEELEAEGAWRVDSNRLIEYDFTQLAEPFDYLGLQLSETKARACVLCLGFCGNMALSLLAGTLPALGSGP